MMALGATLLGGCKKADSPPPLAPAGNAVANAAPPPAPLVKPPPTAVPSPIPSPAAPTAPDQIGAFAATLVDLAPGGRTAPIDASKLEGLTAFILVGTKCPASNAYRDRMRALAKDYGPKGVRFVFVYPNSDDTPDIKRGFHQQAAYAAPMIDDQGGQVARALKATRTSEVIVADKSGRVVYRGPVDDNRNAALAKEPMLARALDETLAGKPVTKPFAQVFA